MGVSAGSSGKLSGMEALSGKFSGGEALSGRLSCMGTLSGKLSTINVQSEYKGPYESVSNLFEDTTLPTKDKFLNDDITIKKVAFVETSNESDGTTVYIGNQN